MYKYERCESLKINVKYPSLKKKQFIKFLFWVFNIKICYQFLFDTSTNPVNYFTYVPEGIMQMLMLN
jgi:hypothetical protein